MSELQTAAWTALFGVLVYVIGQFIDNLILKPIQEQRRLIAEVAFALVYYSNVGGTSEECVEARQSVRKLASQLYATVWTIPFYWIFALFGIVRRRKAIMRASQSLIGYSNSFIETESRTKAKHQDEIRNALNIRWD